MGQDLSQLRRALTDQLQSDVLRPRLVERGDIIPIAVPPWALDTARGNCTTLIVIAPVPTHFLLHVHPWPGLPGTYASSAGAVQLTRCGRERASLVQVRLELRSPRAVVHTLAAVGEDAPRPLVDSLPERDAGASAPAGEPGPELPHEPISERFRRFSLLAREAGAESIDTRLLPAPGYVRLSLRPGCYRLMAASPQRGAPYALLLQGADEQEPERVEASAQGDVTRELCTVRPRALSLSVDTRGAGVDRELALASFPLPEGLPTRFGPQVAERLLEALGGSVAPKRLGPLVVSSLGAQGRTTLPRSLLPQRCYLAVAAAVHGQAVALSLAARAGATAASSTRDGDAPGPRVGFCTGRDAKVELDVEGRGLGLAWLLTVFEVGPARVEP